jgi:hypothetical protein
MTFDVKVVLDGKVKYPENITSVSMASTLAAWAGTFVRPIGSAQNIILPRIGWTHMLSSRPPKT